MTSNVQLPAVVESAPAAREGSPNAFAEALAAAQGESATTTCASERRQPDSASVRSSKSAKEDDPVSDAETINTPVPVLASPAPIMPALADAEFNLNSSPVSVADAETSPTHLAPGEFEPSPNTRRPSAAVNVAGTGCPDPIPSQSSSKSPEQTPEFPGAVTQVQDDGAAPEPTNQSTTFENRIASSFLGSTKAPPEPKAQIPKAPVRAGFAEPHEPDCLSQAQTQNTSAIPLSSNDSASYVRELECDRITDSARPSSPELHPATKETDSLNLKIASTEKCPEEQQQIAAPLEPKVQEEHSSFAVKPVAFASRQSRPEGKDVAPPDNSPRTIPNLVSHSLEQGPAPLKPAMLPELHHLPETSDVHLGSTPGAAHMITKLERQELQFGWNSTEFGRIEVRTTVDQNRVAAVVSVPDSHLRDFLNADSGSLQRALANHSLELSHFSAETSTSGESSRDQQPRLGGASDWTTEAISAPPQEHPSGLLIAHVGLIDLRA